MISLFFFYSMIYREQPEELVDNRDWTLACGSEERNEQP